MPINPKTYNSLLDITYQYKSDVQGNRLINFNGVLCMPDEPILGFCPFTYKANEYGVLSLFGLFPVETEDAIQAGEEVAIHRDGKIKTKTIYDSAIGKALDSAPAGGFARIIVNRF